jgi:hypothetical protein
MRTKLARSLCCLLALAFAVPVFGAPPSVVQYTTYQTSGTNGETNSSVQFNTPTKPGNSIWVVATISDYAGAHTLTVTDTQGNTYTELNQENDGPPGSQTVAHFYASNIVGDTATPNTITLASGYDNYRGLLIVEIGGTTAAPLVGSSGNIQDGLAAGINNVASGSIAVAANQTPALLLALSMNTSGGSSDIGGSGFGGPGYGTGFTPIAQMWNWGLNLGSFESAPVSSAGSVAALFNAPDVDSYVTVAAVFLPTVPQAPPAVTLSTSPSTIVIGSSSTLTWSSPNATSCTASGSWSGNEPTTGTLVVSPTASSTYTLTCTSPTGTSSPVSATITVNPPAPSVSITASTGSIVDGGSTTLTWSSTYATTCLASGSWSGSEPTSGTLAVSPTVTSTYTITCSNSTGNSPARSTTIAVTPAPVQVQPPTVALAASATAVLPGGSSTLTWSSTNATSCVASGAWSGSEAVAGSLTVTPPATSTYTMVCTNASGSSPAKSITVAVTPPKPTVTISANPSSIAAGASSTLTWSSTNATSCTASGSWSGTEAVSGTLTVAPAATSTYMVTCVNSGGSSTVQSAVVSVTSAKAPHFVQYATHQTSGTAGENNSIIQFNAMTKAGDTIWVAATVSDYASVHTISVTDTQGNVYTKLDQKNDEAPGYQSAAHFYASNIVGDSSTPDTITIHWTTDNYKGALIAEISGTTAAPLVGHSAKIQDGLAAGTNNVSSGSLAIAAHDLPAFVIGLSMNTSGGSSDLGGSGYGGPAAGSGFKQVAQLWNWGLNLATLETAVVTTAESTAAVFNAPDTDSYVTVSAVFY